MSKSKNPGTEAVAELKEMKKQRRKDAFKENGLIQAVKGLWIFAEGAALVITSLFAIYQGRYGTRPTWGKDILIVSGVLVLVPAAVLLSKFFRSVGKE